MGYLFESEVYWGGDFGGPVTEGGSHTKRLGTTALDQAHIIYPPVSVESSDLSGVRYCGIQ